MDNMSLKQTRDKLDAKEISVLELVDSYLHRITETNAALNSFITVDTDHARIQARHAQKEIDNGNQEALTGIPYAVKDLYCTKGIRTTAGSRILNEYIPPYNATSIEKCGRAVLLGKTNCDEFAMGASNEYSAFGPVKNPYDLERVPGGSSGGSAAAVAAEQAVFALGTDTGGSTRQPAGFCNIVGLKPTYGRISRYGVIAMASSFDTVSIFANSVEDSAYILKQLAGADPLDSTTPPAPVDDYLASLQNSVQGLRIGVPKQAMGVEGLDPHVREVFDDTVKLLSGLGADVMEVSLPHMLYGLAVYYILTPSEVSSNLARYDGIQYGEPAPGVKSLEEAFVRTRQLGFGAEARRRIMIGTFCLSAGYFDAYYKKAQRVRTLIREDFDEAFRTVDLLLTPTSPTVPFKIGEKDQDPLSMYLADIFTVPASIAGIPAISIPAGIAHGLPVGMQLIGPQFQEKALLNAAHALESEISLPELKKVV